VDKLWSFGHHRERHSISSHLLRAFEEIETFLMVERKESVAGSGIATNLLEDRMSVSRLNGGR